MELKIYNQADELKLTVSPNTSSTVTEEVMGECAVSVGFTHTEFVMLDVNDYIDIEGVRYMIMSQYRPKQKNTQTYEYSVKFYAPIHQAENTLMLFTPDNEMTSEFAYDGGPREHLQLWIDNMNRIAGVNVWKIGSVISGENKVIEYKNLNCWDAAFGSNGIAAAFNTEMWADGYYINLCKAERGERVDLGYLQGLTSLQQEENGEVKFFTRLFPLGSTRNIDASKYGHARLQLPGGVKFVDKNVDIYGVKEEFEEEAFSEIYPKYIGTVQSVRTENLTNTEGRDYTVYYIKDAAISFNPNDYEIPEYTKMIAFQTGELAGRGDEKGNFQATWHEDAKEWEIINTYPDDETQIPGGLIVPNIGDTYIPWNFRMPDEYNTLAEQEFLRAVNDYLNEYSFDTNKYSGQTDRNHIENNNIKLMVGLNVRLQSDTYFTAGYKDTRITKVVRQLNDLYQAAITCTDKIGDGWKKSVDNNINSLKYEVAKSLEQTVIDIIKTGSSKTPSDNNVFSALMSLKSFLSKDRTDETNFLIKFLGGIVTDNIQSQYFRSGVLGTGLLIKTDPQTGESYIEVDRALFRKSATFIEILIQSLKHVGGQIILSPASMHCIEVEETEDAYRCYFEVSDGAKTISNEFVVGDQARSQTFNIAEGVSENVSNGYYWRLVTAIGDNYIDLSKTDCDNGSTIPQAGDDIVQLGNRNTSTRQSAIVLSAYGDDAPSVKLYRGITSYVLKGKEFINFSRQEIGMIADKLKFSTGEDVKETLDNSQFISSSLSRAIMLFDNPTFKELGTGYRLNGISAYGNSTVAVKSDDLPGLYNDSGSYVEALVQGVNTVQSGNGFLWVVEGSANAEYIAYFVAKFSSKLQVNHRSQSSTELTAKWLTSNKGTGNFELYAIHIKYGPTPYYNQEQKFGRCCYFEFVRSGTSNVETLPTPVYISYGTVYNLNSNVQVASSDYVKSQFQVLDNRISSSVSSLTSSINKVSSNLNEDLAQGLLDNTLFTSGAAMIYRSPYFLSNNRPTYNGLETNYYNSNLKMTYFSDNQEVAESLGITYLDIPLNNSTNVGLRITQVVNSGQPERLQYRVQPYAGNSYLISFEAKIPVGYKIIDIAYEIGSAGSSKKWLTPTAGTGDFTTYTYIIQYGTDITENIDHYIGFRLDLDKTGEAGSTQDWYLCYAAIYDMSLSYKNSQDLKQEIVARQTAIEQTDEKIEMTAERTTYNMSMLSSADLVFDDVSFFNSWGGLYRYNNASDENYPPYVERIQMQNPNNTGYVLRISSPIKDYEYEPGLGGVKYQIETKANQTYIFRLTAKIPKGFRIEATSNAIGDSGTRGWFAGTNQEGTDEWQDYFYEVHCGKSGDFGTTGYFYIVNSGSTVAQLTWYICFAAVYDLNRNTTREFKESVNTRFTQTSESIQAIANRFNADGSLKNTSGLVVEDDFAELFSEAVTENGLVKKAELGTYVEYDKNTGEITTNVKISGDKINLIGATTINEYVKIGTDGKLYVKDAYLNGTLELGDAVKLDKSGLGWIGKNSDNTKAIEITSSGVNVNTVLKAKGGSTIGGLKISNDGTLSGVSAIIEDAAKSIMASASESHINNFIIDNIGSYSSFFLFFLGSGSAGSHDVYLPNFNTLIAKRDDVLSGILNLSIFVPRSSNATFNIKAESGATLYDSNGSAMSQISLSKCDILELMLCIIDDTSGGYLGTLRAEYYIKNLRQ